MFVDYNTISIELRTKCIHTILMYFPVVANTVGCFAEATGAGCISRTECAVAAGLYSASA